MVPSYVVYPHSPQPVLNQVPWSLLSPNTMSHQQQQPQPPAPQAASPLLQAGQQLHPQQQQQSPNFASPMHDQYPGAGFRSLQPSPSGAPPSPYGAQAPPSPYGAAGYGAYLPLPGAHSPLPGAYSPLPGAYSPLPGAAGSFPGQQSPYPGQQASPYPGGQDGFHPPPHSPHQPYGHPAYPSSPQFRMAVPPTQPTPGYGPPTAVQWNALPDAQALRRAMQGFGTDEKALVRILQDKDPFQIAAINAAYASGIHRNLFEDISKEVGGSFRYGLQAVVRGPLLADAHFVREAVKGVGTKEALLDDVLLCRSNADMHAIKAAYRQEFASDMVEDVRSDLRTLGMSTITERAYDLVMAARRAEDAEPIDPARIDADVDEIYRATEAKIGTSEMTVVNVMALRNDDQIRAISQAYLQKYRRPLGEVIKSEFSGHLKDILLFQLRHGEDKYMQAADLLEATMSGPGTRDKMLTSRAVRYHWNKFDLHNIKGAYQQMTKGVTLANRIRGETSGDQQRLLLGLIGEAWS